MGPVAELRLERAVPEPRGFEVVDKRAGSQASETGFDSALGGRA
jgi:hypothetical protein